MIWTSKNRRRAVARCKRYTCITILDRPREWKCSISASPSSTQNTFTSIACAPDLILNLWRMRKARLVFSRRWMGSRWQLSQFYVVLNGTRLILWYHHPFVVSSMFNPMKSNDTDGVIYKTLQKSCVERKTAWSSGRTRAGGRPKRYSVHKCFWQVPRTPGIISRIFSESWPINNATRNATHAPTVVVIIAWIHSFLGTALGRLTSQWEVRQQYIIKMIPHSRFRRLVPKIQFFSIFDTIEIITKRRTNS